MSTTTSNGYKLPATGERGTWWNDLISNFQRVNDHTHNGIDSELLPSTAVTKATNTISAAGWLSVPAKAGLYYQDVTVPLTYSTASIQIKLYQNNGTDVGAEILPSIKILTATTYRVYCNDPSIEMKAIYA